MVLWYLLLAVVWPTASYVLTGWDCANPTHVTAYNKDRMCNKELLHLEEHLGHEFHVLQHSRKYRVQLPDRGVPVDLPVRRMGPPQGDLGPHSAAPNQD